jgi:uncharacterized protein with PhoU and TrkA domain
MGSSFLDGFDPIEDRETLSEASLTDLDAIMAELQRLHRRMDILSKQYDVLSAKTAANGHDIGTVIGMLENAVITEDIDSSDDTEQLTSATILPFPQD